MSAIISSWALCDLCVTPRNTETLGKRRPARAGAADAVRAVAPRPARLRRPPCPSCLAAPARARRRRTRLLRMRPSRYASIRGCTAAFRSAAPQHGQRPAWSRRDCGRLRASDRCGARLRRERTTHPSAHLTRSFDRPGLSCAARRRTRSCSRVSTPFSASSTLLLVSDVKIS